MPNLAGGDIAIGVGICMSAGIGGDISIGNRFYLPVRNGPL